MMYEVEIQEMIATGNDVDFYDAIFAFENALDAIYRYTGTYYMGIQRNTALSEVLTSIKKHLSDIALRAIPSIYQTPVKITKNSLMLDILNQYPELKKHLNHVNLLQGFPMEILEKYSEAVRISYLNKKITGFTTDAQRKIKMDFIKNKLIKTGTIQQYVYGKDKSKIPSIINELFEKSQDVWNGIESPLKGARNSISHELLADRFLSSTSFIGSEIPVWIYLGEDLYAGHIDLLLYKDDTLYVVDYKPDMDMGDGYTNFLNSVPQVAGYGLTIQKQTGIKVECIIVNKNGAWQFNPNGILEKINDFMAENKEGFVPPWGDFTAYP